MYKKIKLIIFDMDGVIIDSEYEYLRMQHEVITNDNIHIPIEKLYHLVGLSWDEHFKFISALYKGSKTPESSKNDYFSFLALQDINYNDWSFKQAKIVIDYLYTKGYILALASNAKRATIEKVLIDLDIKERFDLVLSYEDVNNAKPHPEIYLETLVRLGMKKEQAVVIEDSPSGITSAVSAGLSVIAIHDKRFNFDQTEANLVIKNISEIKGIL